MKPIKRLRAIQLLKPNQPMRAAIVVKPTSWMRAREKMKPNGLLRNKNKQEERTMTEEQLKQGYLLHEKINAIKEELNVITSIRQEDTFKSVDIGSIHGYIRIGRISRSTTAEILQTVKKELERNLKEYEDELAAL